MSAPHDPQSAFMLAVLFEQSGGAFAIDSSGVRHIVTDLDATGDRCRVLVMLEALLSRLHPDDKAFIFDAFAECAVEVAGVDEPTRRAA